MNEQEILKRLEALEKENTELRATIAKIPKYPNFEELYNKFQNWVIEDISQDIERWICLDFAPAFQYCIENNIDAKTEFKKLLEKDEQENESRRLNN